MAQLPPKVTNMPPNWPDEFHGFSSAKRGSHRRSISESIAFIEPPMVDECRMSSPLGSKVSNNLEFDRFDDEQLMSMFSDDIAVGPATSSPFDHNSNNDDEQVAPIDQYQQKVKIEADEVQSSRKSEAQATENYSHEKINIDPKRVKRILANRQSAQRSRVRKLHYISELERSLTSLQSEVSVLSPRVAFLDHQRLILNVDNSSLKQRIAVLAQDKICKDAHQEALRREIDRLRKVYQQQNLKLENTDSQPLPNPPPPPPSL